MTTDRRFFFGRMARLRLSMKSIDPANRVGRVASVRIEA
jgi:hypothetical protein